MKVYIITCLRVTAYPDDKDNGTLYHSDVRTLFCKSRQKAVAFLGDQFAEYSKSEYDTVHCNISSDNKAIKLCRKSIGNMNAFLKDGGKYNVFVEEVDTTLVDNATVLTSCWR